MKKIGTTFLIWAMSIVVLFFVFKRCNPPRIIDNSTTTTVYDTIRDTTIVHRTAYVPKLVYQETEKLVYVPVDVDTLAILKDYYTRRFYADTTLNDSTGFFAIYDTIYMNQIWSRYTKAEAYSQTIYKTTTITQPAPLHNKVFFGFGAGGNKDRFGLSGDMMFQTKRDNALALSYDAINKEVWVKTYWKVRLKK